MTTTPPVTPLPALLTPTTSSHDQVVRYLDRWLDAGNSQKKLAIELGLKNANYISMLRSGDDLPIQRVNTFARAVGMSDDERMELLTTRFIELHGAKGQFCFATLVDWAIELAASGSDDEAQLIRLWREAIEPHPVEGYMRSPEVYERIKLALHKAIQAELQQMADEVAST